MSGPFTGFAMPKNTTTPFYPLKGLGARRRSMG
jgi:hypothetical protein